MCSRTCVHDCFEDETPSIFDESFGKMLRNFESELGSSCRLARINVETLEMLLNSVAVQALPLARLQAVLAWISHDRQHRICHIGRLLSCIPGALLGAHELSSLRNHYLVRNNCVARNIVDGMQKEQLPYHSAPEGVALGLQLLNTLRESRVFRFALGCAEFVATVDTGSSCSQLKVSLECKRIAVTECMYLPTTLCADISMRLCYEDVDGQLREMNFGGTVGEDDVRLVQRGFSEEWVRCINFDPCERARAVSRGKEFTLYVQVRNLTTEELSWSHWDMGFTPQYDRYMDCKDSYTKTSSHRSSHKPSRSNRLRERHADKDDQQNVIEVVIEENLNSKQPGRNRDSRRKISQSKKREQVSVSIETEEPLKSRRRRDSRKPLSNLENPEVSVKIETEEPSKSRRPRDTRNPLSALESHEVFAPGNNQVRFSNKIISFY